MPPAKSHMYAYLTLLTTSVPKLLANSYPSGRPCVHGEDSAGDPASLVPRKEPDTSTCTKIRDLGESPVHSRDTYLRPILRCPTR
jgi:hypothetical protein